jgi:hypothetical protein
MKISDGIFVLGRRQMIELSRSLAEETHTDGWHNSPNIHHPAVFGELPFTTISVLTADSRSFAPCAQG